MPSIGLVSSSERTRSSVRSSRRTSRGRSWRARSSSTARSSLLGRNSCSGGSSSRIVTGRSTISSNRPSKSSVCSGSSSASATRRCSVSSAMIIACIFGWRSAAMNMCSVRHSPIPSAPNSRARRRPRACPRSRGRRAGGCSSAQRSTCVEVRVDLGLGQRHVVGGHLPGRAVDRDQVALVELGVADAQHPLLEVDPQRRRARDARLAHPARDERGVRGLAALGGEDPLRGEEAVHVVGLGERPDEDHLAAALRPVDGVVGREHDLPLRRARRRGDPGGQHLEVRVGRERRVQQRVEARRVDRVDRLPARQQALGDGVDREPHRRLCRPLGVARLQHVQRALLDRELRVLHVLVVRLERAQDLHQLGVRLRHHLGHLRRGRAGCARPRPRPRPAR